MDRLVSTQWLAGANGADDLIILDASAHLPSAGRNPKTEFQRGHIAGARFLDLPSWKNTASPVPLSLPTAAQFSARLSALGIRTSDRVILYDDSALRSSARAYFIFKLFGFENTAILDGGIAKWKAENRPVEGPIEASGPSITPSLFPATESAHRNVRSKGDMLANCTTRAAQVIDARDAGRFTGEIEDTVHGLPGGHIPGSRNLHFTALLNDDGTFKDIAAMRMLFEDARIDLGKPITASCGSGMTASVVLFALELLGHQRAALYDGSWGEWGADPDTPKETGPAH